VAGPECDARDVGRTAPLRDNADRTREIMRADATLILTTGREVSHPSDSLAGLNKAPCPALMRLT